MAEDGSSALTAIGDLLVERQQQVALQPRSNGSCHHADEAKFERQLIEKRYSHSVPRADVAQFENPIFNVYVEWIRSNVFGKLSSNYDSCIFYTDFRR